MTTKAKKVETLPVVRPSERADLIIAALPGPISFPVGELGRKLFGYACEADKAEAAAARLVVTDQDSYNSATDLAASAKKVSTELETTRKSYTSVLDAAKTKLMGLFNAPKGRLDAVVAGTNVKMGTWARAEQARRQREADEQRRATEAEAKRLADAAAAMGDKEGAKQIVAEAAAIKIEPAKVTGTGTYGASTVAQKRPVGEVFDKLAFLRWLVSNPQPLEAVLVFDSIDIGKAGLNALAKDALESSTARGSIPGFRFSYNESTSFRS